MPVRVLPSAVRTRTFSGDGYYVSDIFHRRDNYKYSLSTNGWRDILHSGL